MNHKNSRHGQRKRPCRDRWCQDHRSALCRDVTRDEEDQGEGAFDHPPSRGAHAQNVEQQRQRLCGHDHKFGGRDRDEIGESAKQAGLVEMIEHDRRERQFHRNAR